MKYDMFMGTLAIIVVVLIISGMLISIPDKILRIFEIIDAVIWIIFCIDYFIRLLISKDKIKFIKNNIIDLL